MTTHAQENAGKELDAFDDLLARAEKAEASRDTLKAAIECAESFLNVALVAREHEDDAAMVIDTLRAALAACVPPQETEK